MSKVGKNPVSIPEGVTAAISGATLSVKGKLGELKLSLHPSVEVKIEDGKISVTPKYMNNSTALVMWGTQRAHIQNAVDGVSKGFTKELEFKGVGYKVALKGNTLDMVLGFSHNVEYKLPEGVKAEIVSPTEAKLASVNKELVGRAADEIRRFRQPEPYKGKGILYKSERIRRKEGKKK